MESFDYFLNDIKGKRVAVLGIGVSNTPLIRMLLRAGAQVTACDKKERAQLGELAGELEALGATLCLGEGYLDNLDAELVFRTPGMRPDVPALEEARQAGAHVTSEMEVFFDVCPCPIIAVTGSDGKTTTTTLIAEILKAAGKRAHIGGNIGAPLLDRVFDMSPEDYCVVELSSFQLMTMKKSPHIAVITNLAPNHLDVHTDMDEYVESKCNIFAYQSFEDKLILNMDNELTAALAARAKGQVSLFSRRGRPERGVYVEDGVVYRARESGEPEYVIELSDIHLPGAHNVENYLAAIAATEGLAPREAVWLVARTFNGVEHRLEQVRCVDGVTYYNDSIASSPSRTMAGLRCFADKVILIAGGYDKQIPFDELGELIVRQVKTLILCGATSEKIEEAVKAAPGYALGAPELVRVFDLTSAVQAARRRAKEGDIVLFSPACASFDQFPNFMRRGEFFKSLVRAIPPVEAQLI